MDRKPKHTHLQVAINHVLKFNSNLLKDSNTFNVFHTTTYARTIFSSVTSTTKKSLHRTTARKKQENERVTSNVLVTNVTNKALSTSFAVGDLVAKLLPEVLLGSMAPNASSARDTSRVSFKDDIKISVLREEVIALQRKQMEINNTAVQFSVQIKCQPKQKWNYACVHQNCSQLSNNVQERVKSLFSEKTVLTKVQDDLLTSISAQIPENDVILLTAVSSNHFDEMQAMFRTLHAVVYPELAKRENFSMVVWDLGLSATQRKQMEDCCRCQVVTFPFDKFTKRMRDIRSYMWKPLVIRMVQKRARKYAVWQDASIRYTHFPGDVFERGMRYGLQLLRQKGGVSIPHRTLPETFAYFGQSVCNFYPYPEIATGFGVYKNDPFVVKAVTNPWARCGFEENCICPKPSWGSYKCHYGPCHRFDQSALSIITDTLYSTEVYRILLLETEMKQYFWVGRNDKDTNYFSSVGC
uniref:Uncharacterized protein n=1 Tax=Arion vulgaris TaxID=1028688 RepID=A0A0B7AC84_9EUPU